MASVQGAAPRLVAGSGPDCVTTNRDFDTTYVGTSPDQLPLAIRWKRKRPIYYERKKEIATHQRTHLSQRKEVWIAFALAFAFALALHLSFSMVKGIKLKEKLKRKKKGVRIQAIIGRIRTRDPDLILFRVRTRIRIYGSGSGCSP